MSQENELPQGAIVVFRDGSNEVQIGINGGDPDFAEVALTLAVAQSKIELLAYRLAKQQFEQQQGAGILRPAPNVRVPKV